MNARFRRLSVILFVAAATLALAGCSTSDSEDLPDDHPAVDIARDWATHLFAGRLADADALAAEEYRTDTSIIARAQAASAANPDPASSADAPAVRSVTGGLLDDDDAAAEAIVEIEWSWGSAQTTETLRLMLDPLTDAWQVQHALPAVGVDGFTAEQLVLDGSPGIPAGAASRPHGGVIVTPGPHVLAIDADHPALDAATDYPIVMGLTGLVGPPVEPRVGETATAAIASLVADASSACASACIATHPEDGALELQPLSASGADPALVTAPDGATVVSLVDPITHAPLTIEGVDLINGTRDDVSIRLADGGRGWSMTVDCGGATACDLDPSDHGGVFVATLTARWDGAAWTLTQLR